MYRSFFPTPRLFFPSAVIWLLLAVVIWFGVGGALRSAISIDHYIIPPDCPAAAAPATPGASPAVPPAGAAATGAASSGASSAPAAPGATAAAAVAASAAANPAATNCLTPDPTRFLTGGKVWQYEYVLLVSFLFCAFWYFYRRNEWYWWSVVGSTVILLVIYFNVEISAWINDWQGRFFDILQQALSKPRSVSPETFYGQIIQIFIVLMPNIIVLVLLDFFTSHYIFRWRTAMNRYYMSFWPSIRTVEGAAQRVQEDTMRFAATLEDLGTSFFSSLITLVVFLPILWSLSSHITQLPLLGDVPGSLVWVALVTAAAGTALLALVGIRLPGLQYNNQRVEAAYRKELVYGEDHADRAEPPTVRELFANVRKNYFRIYFNYTYFNLAKYIYLNMVGYVPLLAMAPSILAGTLTLGLYQQVQNAFDQVSSSFQFFARAWSTIVELLSIRKRLVMFESHIPAGAAVEHDPPLPAAEAGM